MPRIPAIERYQQQIKCLKRRIARTEDENTCLRYIIEGMGWDVDELLVDMSRCTSQASRKAMIRYKET